MSCLINKYLGNNYYQNFIMFVYEILYVRCVNLIKDTFDIRAILNVYDLLFNITK